MFAVKPKLARPAIGFSASFLLYNFQEHLQYIKTHKGARTQGLNQEGRVFLFCYYDTVRCDEGEDE